MRVFVHEWHVRGKRDGDAGDGKVGEGKEERLAGWEEEN